MTDLLTVEEMRLAERIAKRAAYRWSLVEFDDVQSHLLLWLVEHHPVVDRYRTDPNGAGKLYVALRREASKFAAGEQEARVGRPLREDNHYSPSMVERILPFVFQPWPQTVVAENPVTGELSRPIPHKTDVALAILADVSGAFHGLDKPSQEVLKLRFEQDFTFPEISDLLGISEAAATKRVDRAVQRLVNSLAGERL